MKARSKLIQKNVEKAKKYLRDIEDLEHKVGVYQADISELALQVCTIRHGGISNDIYTIKDFAEEVGLKPKTLQNWIAAYRTVVPIVGRDKINTQKDWTDVRKTKRVIGDSANKRDVQEIFDIYNRSGEKPFLAEFRNNIAGVKHLKYMLEKRELTLINYDQWVEMMEQLDICSDMINKYLSKKSKKAG
ncbi:MAG: hypothetical protein O6939_03535 [Bacteroidetes bacterium]|nr:hypothetical protein [Bacteroidota bacterium]